MKNKIILSAFVFMAFLLGLPLTTQAGYVNGYFKSNGTYVPGYYRSNPNAYKSDNYSYKGDNLFNTSYYYPTKNYSDSWYTPSYVTQPNYYTGKSYYDLNTYPQVNQTYSPPSYNTYQVPTYNSYPSYSPPVSNTSNYILSEGINYSRSIFGR